MPAGDQNLGRTPRGLWLAVAKQGLVLAVAAFVVHGLFPQIVAVFASTPRLGQVELWWLPVLLMLETGSFAAAWALARTAVPSLTWFTAATAQLASNAASKTLPGGAVVGGAVYYRMLARSGLDPARIAAALTINSYVSTLVLFALPAIATLGAALTAPVPRGLGLVAAGGTAIFIGAFVAGLILIHFDRPLLLAAGVVSRAGRWIGRLLGRQWRLDDGTSVVARRDEWVGVVGPRWPTALGAATTNWLLDYMALVATLYAIGAHPRLSLVLLAYSASAVLAMIPLTPGGLGFVEAGLAAMLTAAGVPVADALLATLIYRLVSFWLPIAAGAGAYVLFRYRSRRRFGYDAG